MGVETGLVNVAFDVAMATLGRLDYARLMAQARKPEQTQLAALRAILEANAATEQGSRLDLGAVKGTREFRNSVPIHDHEDLREQITRQIEDSKPIVAPEAPLMYARSSGTTGAAKYIPVTPAALRQMRQAQRVMAYVQHKAVRAFCGKVLGIGGSCREEVFASGALAGATTGLIYETMPRMMRAKYVVPTDVFEIEDYDRKYQTIARLAVWEPNITVIATANPSSILRLMQSVCENFDSFIADAPPHRARFLNRIAERSRSPTIADIWPGLRSVVTWLAGGCAIAAAAVRAQLPSGAIMVDAGYVASEVRGTIVVDVENNLAMPLLGDVFFEFVPVAEWEAGSRETLLLHELEDGADYHVIVTTIAGLLRYHMNDVVRVSGRIHSTPTLQFVRKGRGVTNITGEKLSEDQVHAAIASLSPSPLFYIMLADVAASAYRVLIEGQGDSEVIAASIDAELQCLNLEYRSKRESGRLKPPVVSFLRSGTANAYHKHCVETKNQREAQAKVLALQTVEEFDFDYAPYELAHAAISTPVR